MPTDSEEKRRDSPWMSPPETAVYLDIALGTLRNWTSAKFIPHAKRGRVVRYNREILDRWLSRGSCPGRMTIADVGNSSRQTGGIKE